MMLPRLPVRPYPAACAARLIARAAAVVLAAACVTSGRAQGISAVDSAQGARTAARVQSGDDLGGIHYYIKIVEHDTSWQSRMPVESRSPVFTVVNIQPVPMKRVQPQYPAEARSSGARGTVWLRVKIGVDGIVRDAKVMKADSEIFVKPAVEAARQWIFNPAMYDGKPIEVYAAIPFTFAPEPAK